MGQPEYHADVPLVGRFFPSYSRQRPLSLWQDNHLSRKSPLILTFEASISGLYCNWGLYRHSDASSFLDETVGS
jgi:hypothetical protein